MKNWSDYFDSNGLLTQKSKDGGDTPAHSSLAFTAAKLDSSINFPSPLTLTKEMYLLVTPNRMLIRNPINYNSPNDTSRDQYRGIVCSLAINEKPLWVAMLLSGLPRNNLKWPKYPNNDIFSPEDLGMFYRGLNKDANLLHKGLYWLADSLTLVNVLITCFWSTRKANRAFQWLSNKWSKLWFLSYMEPNNDQNVPQSPRGPDFTSNDLDLIHILILGALRNTTLINLISRKTYAKYRPMGPQYALNSYFSSDDSPPVNELFVNILQEFFK